MLTELPLDLLDHVLYHAISHHDSAVALQSVSQFFHSRINYHMTIRFKQLRQTANVLVIVSSPTGQRDVFMSIPLTEFGYIDHQLIVDRLLPHYVLPYQTRIVTVVMGASAQYFTVSKFCRFLTKALPKTYQRIFYVELPSNHTLISYRCSRCNDLIMKGTKTFCSILRKHKHNKPYAVLNIC